MGRGDKKSRKGKISAGSFGNTRPSRKKKAAPVSKKAAGDKKAAPKKAAAKKVAVSKTDEA